MILAFLCIDHPAATVNSGAERSQFRCIMFLRFEPNDDDAVYAAARTLNQHIAFVLHVSRVRGKLVSDIELGCKTGAANDRMLAT